MSEKDLRQISEFMSTFCDRYFGEHGGVSAMYHVVLRSGQHSIIRPPYAENKELSIMAIRVLFEELDVVRYVYLDEAWVMSNETASEDEMNAAMRDGVKTHPKRFEVVFMSGEDETCGQLCWYRKIIRDAGKRPSLGPLVQMPTKAESEGRMIGLLPQRGTRQ